MDSEPVTRAVPADLIVIYRDPRAARTIEERILPLLNQAILVPPWGEVGMCSMILPNVAAIYRPCRKDQAGRRSCGSKGGNREGAR